MTPTHSRGGASAEAGGRLLDEDDGDGEPLQLASREVLARTQPRGQLRGRGGVVRRAALGDLSARWRRLHVPLEHVSQVEKVERLWLR